MLYDYRKRKICLEDERWLHINKNHPETDNEIDFIRETVSNHKYCVVVYKVLSIYGFIITSYFTRRPSFKRKLIWKKQ